LPERPEFGRGPATVILVKRVTGWITNEDCEHIEQFEEFEERVEPVVQGETQEHFNRRLLLHHRLCEVAMQMHRIQETEDNLMDHLIYSVGEHQKVGLPHGDGRELTPFQGGSGWDDRMFHTIDDILGIEERHEPACYTEAGVGKLQRSRSYLEWHPDKTNSLCAGPRAEKIRQDWYQMIDLAREVASCTVARERYWKYGIWTDGNVDRAGAHRLPLKIFPIYKYHPVPVDAVFFEWVIVQRRIPVRSAMFHHRHLCSPLCSLPEASPRTRSYMNRQTTD